MTLSRKEMVKKAALDVLKAFIIGVAAAAAAAIILFACGFLFGSFQIVNGFEVVKDGLFADWCNWSFSGGRNASCKRKKRKCR